MFIENALKVKNDFWRYLVGSLIVIAANVIAQIPFGVAVAFKLSPENIRGLSQSELMKVLDSNLTFFLIMIPFAVSLLFLFLVIKQIHNQSIVSVTTSRSSIDWGRVRFSFFLLAVLIVVTTGIEYIAAPEDFVWNFQATPFLILLVLVVVFIPLQTSLEEYLFRGYLMQGLGVLAKNRWIPLLVTSLIFGGLHFANPEVEKLGSFLLVYYIGTGLFLGIITLMDEGMELALGFHAANNIAAALLVTTDWSAFQTHAILLDISEPDLLPVYAALGVFYPLMLFIYAKKYGWNNWVQKLTGNIQVSKI
jgi:membrane protease YdiL (CAAX protease family)